MQTQSYIYRTYKAERANGLKAKDAMGIARMAKTAWDFPWQSSYSAPTEDRIANELEDLLPDMDEDKRYELANTIADSATYSENVYQWAVLLRDGHVVFVRIVWDSEHDFNDFRGEYSDYREKGAIMTEYARSRRSHYVGRYRLPRRIQSRKRPEYYERERPNYDHEHVWFVPTNCPIEDGHKGYRKLGYAKHDAWLKALEVARQEEAQAHGEGLEVFGAIATAFTLDGEEVGDSSVWGIEIADDESYLTECANDEIHQAVYEAKKKATV